MSQRMLAVWFVAILTVTLPAKIYSQDNAAASCCAANLMDSGDRVVIDTLFKRTGTFKAIKVLMCTTTKTYVQLWKDLHGNSTKYELFYQWDFQPSALNEFVLKFDQDTYISSDIRIGLFSPQADKHNLPYIFSASSKSVVSNLKYGQSQKFAVGDTIAMDDVMWPRTFRYNAILCEQSDCSDVSSLLPLVVPGPPGPPGPAGQQGPEGKPCDAFGGGLVGDAVGGINDQINDMRSDNQRLEELLVDIGSKVNELTQGNFVTGTCPPGYLSATYGIGSCYIIFRSKEVQFIEAHFACSDTYKGQMVDIFTDLEQTYLRNTITQLIGSSGKDSIEEFWTSGMYSDDLLQWVWYDEVRRTSIPMLYENWYSELARSSQEGFKICMKLVVDASNNESYWEADYCENRHYFICKVDKKCL